MSSGERTAMCLLRSLGIPNGSVESEADRLQATYSIEDSQLEDVLIHFLRNQLVGERSDEVTQGENLLSGEVVKI